ncbi:unnamed protein product [Arctogadus glacialis]
MQHKSTAILELQRSLEPFIQSAEENTNSWALGCKQGMEGVETEEGWRRVGGEVEERGRGGGGEWGGEVEVKGYSQPRQYRNKDCM